jgi:hypothetical protein
MRHPAGCRGGHIIRHNEEKEETRNKNVKRKTKGAEEKATRRGRGRKKT